MATSNAINANTTGIVIYSGAGVFTATNVTQFNAIVGGASNALTSVAPSATSGVPFISQGSSSNPAFGTAVVAGGGTGATTLTLNGVLYGNGTSPVQATAQGGANTVLAANAGAPAFTGTPTVTSITFGSGTALSVYQQGTFTPGMQFGNGGTTGIVYNGQNGFYTRIGNIVYVHGSLGLSSKGSSTGVAELTGLPFTVNGNDNPVSGAWAAGVNGPVFDSGFTFPSLQFLANSTVAAFVENHPNGNGQNMNQTNFVNSMSFYFWGWYQI